MIKGYLIDLDGMLYRREEPVERVVSFMKYLQETKRRKNI
jgi:ribonucleotide monophosphatase NagD (HAD superfamily)